MPKTELNRLGVSLWEILEDLEKLQKNLDIKEVSQFKGLCENASLFLNNLKDEKND